MTRLSEALKKAAVDAGAPVEEPSAPAAPAEWRFAPVETMHVPEEPEPIRTPQAPSLSKPLQFGAADRHKLIVGERVDTSLLEQYRHLAAVLHHSQKQSNAHSVMVTSALPAEGKTLTATNLALTLSESYQRRVLLIDADLRRPRMREMFALPATEGLTDSLALPREGRLPVQQVSPTLWVLTSGRMLPDPMSLLVSPAMKELLEDAKAAFDWVVVDTPPIAILPDANLLSAMIDTALLVVSAKATPYPMVQRAAQAIGPNRILGVVLNRAEKAAAASTYGYYGERYQRHQPGHALSPRRKWFGWLRNSGSEA